MSEYFQTVFKLVFDLVSKAAKSEHVTSCGLSADTNAPRVGIRVNTLAGLLTYASLLNRTFPNLVKVQWYLSASLCVYSCGGSHGIGY